MDKDEKKSLLIKLAVFGCILFLLFLFGIRYDSETGTRNVAVIGSEFTDQLSAPFHMSYGFDLRNDGAEETEKRRYFSMSYGNPAGGKNGGETLFEPSLEPGETVHYRVSLGVTRGRNMRYNYVCVIYSDKDGIVDTVWDETLESGYPFQIWFQVSEEKYLIENVTATRGGWIVSIYAFIILLVVLIVMSVVFVPTLEGLAIRTRSVASAARTFLLLSLADIGVLLILAACGVPLIGSLVRALPKGPLIFAFMREHMLNVLIVAGLIIAAAVVCLYKEHADYVLHVERKRKVNVLSFAGRTILQMGVHGLYIACVWLWILVGIAILKLIWAMIVLLGFIVIMSGYSICRMSGYDLLFLLSILRDLFKIK